MKRSLTADIALSSVLTAFAIVLYQLADPKDFYFQVDDHWSIFGIGETVKSAPAPHVVHTTRVYPPKPIQDRFWPSNNFNDE